MKKSPLFEITSGLIVNVGGFDCKEMILHAKKCNSSSSSLSSPSLRIISFEPDHRAVATARAIQEQGGVDTSQHEIIEAAVGEEDAENVDFFLSGDDNLECSSLFPFAEDVNEHWRTKHEMVGTAKVKVVRLDSFFKERGIETVDFLHVDAQGADLSVIRSLGDRISSVKMIQVEVCVSPHKLYKNQFEKEEIVAFLQQQHGFHLEKKWKQFYHMEENLVFSRVASLGGMALREQKRAERMAMRGKGKKNQIQTTTSNAAAAAADDDGNDSSLSSTSAVHYPSLGRWGQWGNQVFQYIFLRIFCRVHRCEPKVPANWEGRQSLKGADVLGVTDETSLDLPVVADRPVLGHPSFREWAATKEPMLSYAKKNPSMPISGKDLRREIYQVNADSLKNANRRSSEDNVLLSKVLSLSNFQLWGWFQFHSSQLVSFREEIVSSYIAPRAEFASAMDDLLDRINRDSTTTKDEVSPRPIIAVHARLIDYVMLDKIREGAHPKAGEKLPEKREPPTFPLHSLAKDDASPYAPPSVDLFVAWTKSTIEKLHSPSPPLVILCTDDPKTALPAFEKGGVEVFTPSMLLERFPSPILSSDKVPVFFLDWLFLSRADFVAISNSTFSFSACLVNNHSIGDDCNKRFARVDITGQRFDEFDPWNANSLLTK